MKHWLLTAGFALLAACSPKEGASGPYDYCAAGKTTSLFLIDRTTPPDAMDRSVMMDSLATVVDSLGFFF